MKKNKSGEIERRYLAKYLPSDLNKYNPIEIEDVKIITGEVHPHLRLRRKDNEFFLTKKYPNKNGEGMIEETITLNKIEFETLKKLPHTAMVKKRFNYKFQGRITQIDIWEDDLKGLVIIEFEFENKREFKSFKMPDFCLKDITGLEWLAGGMLSGKKYRDIKDQLVKLGYKPIYISPVRCDSYH